MSGRAATQLNVRSEFAVRRVRQLVHDTGMTAVEIVEKALESFTPHHEPALVPGLVRKGRLLVGSGTRRVTAEEVQASIDETREGVRD